MGSVNWVRTACPFLMPGVHFFFRDLSTLMASLAMTVLVFSFTSMLVMVPSVSITNDTFTRMVSPSSRFSRSKLLATY